MAAYFLLFLLSFVSIFFLALISFVFRKTALARHKWFLLGLFITICIAGVISRIMVWHDPYWYDPDPNGLTRMTSQEERGFTIVGAGFWEIPLIALYCAIWFAISWLKKRLK